MIPTFWKCLVASPAVVFLSSVSVMQAAIISINLTDFASDVQQINEDKTFGIPGQNTVTAGWVNLNRTLNADPLPFADGTASSVSLTGTAPNGWGTGNGAYADTPLLGGIDDYTGTANPTSLTLNNLAANFPNGYKLIVYVGGFNANRGASISDGTTTYYYQTLNPPVAPVTFERTATTVDLGDGAAPFAQYAVFGDPELLTTDTVTLTLDTLYGGGAILGGFQILMPSRQTPRGVPYDWFLRFDIPVDDEADDDLDGVPGWKEYFAGTVPTNALSRFQVLTASTIEGNLILFWTGGTNGYPGNWSMRVSSNLTDWTLLESRTIPRDPGGTNTWVHTNAVNTALSLFYRPCVENVQ